MPFKVYPAVDENNKFPAPVRQAMALYTELIAAFAGKSLETTVANHQSNVNNPHVVTKAQVGLGNVDNTADANKPVSALQTAAINKTAAGLLAKTKIVADSAAVSTTTILYNFPSFTFKAGRNYKIKWYAGFVTSAAGSYWNLSINTCAVADAFATTTGMTAIEAKSVHTSGAALADYFNLEGLIDPFATDTTLQIKFAVAFANAGTGTFQIAQNGTLRPGFITIEDLGSQI